jgi:hypothetical protein
VYLCVCMCRERPYVCYLRFSFYSLC